VQKHTGKRKTTGPGSFVRTAQVHLLLVRLCLFVSR